MIYKSKLKELFTGSFIEVQKICTILDDFNIKYIIQDQKKSAILAGFGITNLFYTHRLLVYENDYELALKICKN
ncbi:MAG: putative signal transducing protein [Flavobacteriaceae bacterium]